MSETGTEEMVDRYLNGSHDELEWQLNLLSRAILDINRLNGWNVTEPGSWEGSQDGEAYRVPATIAACHGELSRLLEAYRNGGMDRFKEEASDTKSRIIDYLDGKADAGDGKIPAVMSLCHSELSEATEAYSASDVENFKEEIADTVIRILDCMAGLEMDIVGPIIAKLKKNRTRGYRHGGKRV